MTRNDGRTLRVAVDAITPGASLGPNSGGMRMYITTLLNAMSVLDESIDYVVFESSGLPLSELNDLPNVRRVTCPGVPVSRPGRVLYQNTLYPVLLRRWSPDVTLDTCNVAPLGSPRPFVVVIQSLQYFDHSETYARLRGRYLRYALKTSVRRAARVIAVSAYAKEMASRLTSVNPNKIHVVHHGVPPLASLSPHSNKRIDSRPYILTVTTLYRYKNVERLIRAYARLCREYRVTQRLRIVGGDADITARELQSIAAAEGVAKTVDFIGAVDHDEIAVHYTGADLFVYPSLSETFGLPILEAMALGTPVVASRASSIPEIAGDAAQLINPLDIDDMVHGMAQVLLVSERREQLRRLGRIHAGRFTWQLAAQQTLEVLKLGAARIPADAHPADDGAWIAHSHYERQSLLSTDDAASRRNYK